MVCDLCSTTMKQEAGKQVLWNLGLFFLPYIYVFQAYYPLDNSAVIHPGMCWRQIGSCFKRVMRDGCYVKFIILSILPLLLTYHHKAIQFDFKYSILIIQIWNKLSIFFSFLSLTSWLHTWASNAASLFLFVCLVDWCWKSFGAISELYFMCGSHQLKDVLDFPVNSLLHCKILIIKCTWRNLIWWRQRW